MPKSSTVKTLLPPMWVIFTALFVGAVWLTYTLKEIVVLLVVGYCIAYLINPLVSFLERHKVRRSLGVVFIFAMAVSAVALLVVTTLPTLARETEKLATNLPSYIVTAKDKTKLYVDQVRTKLPQRLASKLETQSLLESLPAPSSEQIKNFLIGIFNALLGGYSLILMVVNLLLLPFIVFYLAVDFDSFHKSIVRLFPTTIRKKVLKIALEIDKDVAAFVRGQLIVGVLLVALYAIGLGFVGVQLWLVLAIISGLGNFVPYLGSFIGIVLSVVMALVTFADFSGLVRVLIVYGVVQFLEGNFITPKIIGDKVGLSPLAVILAIFIGGKLFGLLGLFLAVPGAAAFKVLWRHGHEWLLLRAELAPS